MVKIDDNFDKLILFDGVKLSPPLLEENEMRIHASDFAILNGHPLNKMKAEINVSEATFIFKGVSKSVRTIYEYRKIIEQNELSPPYTIVDVLSESSSEKKQNFGLEGVLTEPYAYVDWEIEADSFTLEVPKMP